MCLLDKQTAPELGFCTMPCSGSVVLCHCKPFHHDIRPPQEQDFSLHDFSMSCQPAWPKCDAPVHDWVAWDWSTSATHIPWLSRQHICVHVTHLHMLWSQLEALIMKQHPFHSQHLLVSFVSTVCCNGHSRPFLFTLNSLSQCTCGSDKPCKYDRSGLTLSPMILQ